MDPSGRLVSPEGRLYPLFDGIPVLLRSDVPETIGIMRTSLQYASGDLQDAGGLYLETLGVTDSERRLIAEQWASRRGGSIDPVAQGLIPATNGIAYKNIASRLHGYPIPDLSLPTSNGASLLDIGCNWGRWSFAAARKGYKPTGIDPSLGSVSAAARIARELDIDARFVVGDARYLPFSDNSFDVVFSYSVLQHFGYEDAAGAFKEIGRVLKPGGTAMIQMPNAWGIRSIYHQARRGFGPARGFDVRYRNPMTLSREISSLIRGNGEISIDCFFGLGLQKSDLPLMSGMARTATLASEFLKKIPLPFLYILADSLYVKTVKQS